MRASPIVKAPQRLKEKKDQRSLFHMTSRVMFLWTSSSEWGCQRADLTSDLTCWAWRGLCQRPDGGWGRSHSRGKSRGGGGWRGDVNRCPVRVLRFMWRQGRNTCETTEGKSRWAEQRCLRASACGCSVPEWLGDWGSQHTSEGEEERELKKGPSCGI